MSLTNEGKKGSSTESREEISGTEGLERTVGTSITSTGTMERIGVAPAMPDTGSLDHAHTDVGNEHLGTTTNEHHTKK